MRRTARGDSFVGEHVCEPALFTEVAPSVGRRR